MMVLKDFNLLISTRRGLESDTCSEIWFLLGEIGDKESLIEKTQVSGLISAKTTLNPFKAIKGLRKLLKERPIEFRYTLKVIPVEAVVPTMLDDIKIVAQRFSSKIREKETFRITVEKRHSNISIKDVIEVIAEGIDRKVNLVSPDKIVLIEILGGLTGISVIKPDDILFVVKEKFILLKSNL